MKPGQEKAGSGSESKGDRSKRGRVEWEGLAGVRKRERGVREGGGGFTQETFVV